MVVESTVGYRLEKRVPATSLDFERGFGGAVWIEEGAGAALHLCENPEEILNALKECELDEDGLDNFLENIRGKHIALQAIREEVERTRTLSLTFLQHQLEAWVSQAEDRAETDHTLPQSRPDQGTVDELRKQGCCPEMTGRYRWPIRDGP